jgi:GT2 family glycosyltransferase
MELDRSPTDPAEGLPAVTVIVPTRDRSRYLAEAIHSVLGQTFADLELFVIDDGSTDDTRGLVCAIDDPRLRYLHQDASGISAALNRGLRRARGRYVARLDSDDVWTPDMLATLVPILESQPEVGVVYARGQAMDASGRVLPNLQGAPERFPGDSLRSLVYDDMTCNVALVARRACFERAGLYDEGLLSSEDWDMWLRVARHYRFAFVDKVVARIRWHDGNLTGPGSPRLAEVLVGRSSPLDKLFRDPDLPPAVRAMRSVAYANIDLFRGQRWLQAGKPGRAVRSLGSAVRTSDHRVTMLTRVVWFTVARPVLGRWATGRRAMDALADVRRRRRTTPGPGA